VVEGFFTRKSKPPGGVPHARYQSSIPTKSAVDEVLLGIL
jgi:hypothetical protein